MAAWIIFLVLIILQIILTPIPAIGLATNNTEALGNGQSNNNGLKLGDHTRLTEEKKLALETFRNRVLPKLTKDFMKQDLYLLRFLEAKKFDLEKAELMLLNHLQFREEKNLDEIQDEDWSDMEKEFPYRVDGIDKLGRPIIQFDFGKWDLNKATEDGKQERMLRYFDKMLEEAALKVIDLQNQGKNVTQFTWLVDMSGVNMAQHIGFKSGRLYYHGPNTVDNNYPGMSSYILLLNSPTVFDSVFGMIKSILTKETGDIFIPYRTVKDWKPFVDNLIDPEQLPPEYGGIKGTETTPAGLLDGFQRRKDGSWWFWKGYF